MQLTPQQQAVVDHDDGPALVFAVAGAGKTTAMVHRIERLVHDGVFAAPTILATSFGRANVRDLRQALSQWSYCAGVDARTLHSLGRHIILQAQQLGHQRHLRLNGNGRRSPGSSTQRLLNQTIAVARQRQLPFARELDGLDRADFLDYVGFCKGNLLYPDLQHSKLPATARRIAGQAPPPAEPLGWYLDLFRLFEEVRQQRGQVTFDDMLLTGWETLVSYSDVQEMVQSKYLCLVVDEFQDINLAQSEMLHQLAAPHGNYMAVGDDDQTIYEWRGAKPHFILNFAKKYEATTFLISENFRCPAAPLALANGIIQHNKKREPKRLSLTRGFAGQAKLVNAADSPELSRQLVTHLLACHQEGVPLGDIAVLVRLNAQTPPIEQALVANEIPYRVSQPFYERREIRTLINYGRFAWLERELQAEKQPFLAESTREKLGEAWRDLCNRPKRYIPAALREQLLRDFVSDQLPLSEILNECSYRVPEPWLADRLEILADDLTWLAGTLEKPAHSVLQKLVERLDYITFVRESSGFPQTGDGRAASVESFIDYARHKGSLIDFLKHVAQLASERAGQQSDDAGDVVTLSTMHQAKGLEWPVVFVAQCNEKIMPFNAVRVADVEEERRLFYVALTRSKRDLYLYVTQDERPSRFLEEANCEQVIPALQSLRQILDRDPAGWQAEEALLLARTIPALRLQRYFEAWWDVPLTHKTEAAATMNRFFAAVAQQQMERLLELPPGQAAWWQNLAPSLATASNGDGAEVIDFPGLDKLRPRRRRIRLPGRRK